MTKMLSIYTISVHFLGPYIVDLLSEIRDKAAAKILHNRRTQSYHEQSEARICQENFKEKETLENTKPEDPETEDILTESNTKILKKTLAGQNYIEYCGKSISFRCPILEIYVVNYTSSLFSS